MYKDITFILMARMGRCNIAFLSRCSKALLFSYFSHFEEYTGFAAIVDNFVENTIDEHAATWGAVTFG